MENLSLSRQPNKSATATKKACNGSGGRTTYDDVFGGPPKFGVPSLAPRVDDYAEIFGGFHAVRGGGGSIPVLDLPVVEEEEVFFDVSSSGFDYDEVFGGCGRGFGVSFEELMMEVEVEAEEEESNADGGEGDSSEEAWTPAETESLGEDSDLFEKNQSLLNGDSYESIDGNMEFNISYHKANHRSDEDMSNGVTHVTQLPDVSGYAFLVNKTTPLGNTYNENPLLQMTDDSDIQIDFSGRQKNLRKTMSHPANSNTCEQTFENSCKAQKVYRRNSSLPNETFVTISEINLRTQPSEVPPPCRPAPLLDVKKGDFSEVAKNYKNVASEETTGDTTPPFFDVEVDASSSAAVSAAAMKDAMEKAQASLKNAKELLERKRERHHSRKERKDKEGKVFSNVDCLNMKNERVHETYERPENRMTFSVGEERPKVLKTTKAVPDPFEGQKFFNVDNTSDMYGQSDKLDGADEWKEATQFFELVRTDRSKTCEQENSDQILVPNTKINDLGQKDKKGAMETVDHLQINDKKTKTNSEDFKGGENGRKLKVTRVSCEQLENNGRSEASKAAHRRKGHEKKKKIVQEVSELGENEKKLRLARNPVENEKKSAANQSEKPENLVEVKRKDNRLEHEKAVKHTENEQLLEEAYRCMADERRSKGSYEREDEEKRQRAAFKREESDKMLKEALEQAEKELNEAREREESEKRAREAREREERREKRAREARESEEREKRAREAREREESEKRAREAREREEREKRAREAREREESEKRVREARDREEREKRAREAHEREESEKRAREACDREESEKRVREELEQMENEKKLKEEYEKKRRETLEQMENEKRLKEECEKKRREILEQMENERRLKEECEKRQREAFEQEQDERRLKESQEQEENEKKRREASEREENEKSRIGANELVEAMRQKVDKVCEEEDNFKTLRQFQETVEHEMSPKEVFEKEETETDDRLSEEGETEDLKGLSRAHEETYCDENGKKLKMAEGSHVHIVKDDLRASDKACGLDDIENPQLASQHEENGYKVCRNGVFGHERNGKVQTASDSEMRSEAVETENVKVEGVFEVPGLAHGNLEHDKHTLKMEDVEEPSLQDHSAKRTGQFEKMQSAYQMDFETEKEGKKIADEWGQKENYIREAQVGSNQKENKDKIRPTQPVESVQNGRKMESAQPSVMEGKGNIHKTGQWVNLGQNAARKEMKMNKTHVTEEREDDRMKRERELGKERLRKIEEEREREREREKDRMAVDLATLEAREKAERNAVERATSEARQRALAEARERLEKACAEAKEKTFAERSSMEARLRAERAAVERATAEARERAVEKAMAERATESRDRFERTYSEKFSVSSRSGAMRTSSSSSDLQDQKYQSGSTFSSSKYQCSSVYGASYNTDRSEGVEGESAQRCKARLERHQRTAERAAKALAEKNMRDLLAQREQAERNRLAETLDADVKRWSSGKEGNLRALLSTLQYILGPDSGWHPIPLTEVITSAAVKKAYRKATLCVHPDKLQQRGASIQQKYICEKVFDLLKEAWNTFNSEER